MQMNHIIPILLFICTQSIPVFGQERVVHFTPEHFDEQQRIPLADLDQWIFHKGTNENWRQSNIVEEGWIQLKPTQLSREIEDKDGRLEGWFRLKFTLSKNLAELPLSIDRNLWAATDIYLDGKIIGTFGKPGSNRSNYIYFNPNHKIPTPLELQAGREHLLAIHYVNYEGPLTPGKVKLNEENLSDLLYLTGPRFTILEQHYRRSSYIHSTLWIAVSFIFMMLFWMMAAQNRNERLFKLITYLSVTIFLLATVKSLVNFSELNFAQEKVRYILYGSIGPLANVLILVVTEWIINRKNSILTIVLSIALVITSVIAHLYNISIPFGIVNTTLTAYFFYLLISKYRQISKTQWAVLVAMAFYIISINIYLILRKVSLEDHLLYGNLIFSIVLFVPLISMLIFVALRFREIFQERERAQLEKNKQLEAINAASAKFVPSPFLNFLGKENILDATLGDHVEKQVTVLFSDIRDYTSHSEKMSPEENFQFVNTYNQRMGPIIQKHNGFVNQYLGDGIMAIFPENTEDTLKAAIEMQLELRRYNKLRISNNKTAIRMGIGLHTGSLIMGIIGDEQRMDAATISDTVNVASRIEGLTKYFGVNILLSEACVCKLPDQKKFNLRYLGMVQVKGKEETVKVYECFDGDEAHMITLKKEHLEEFQKGIHLYFNQDFTNAKNTFENLLTKNPKDKPVDLLFQKTNHLKDTAIDPSWTGVERMLEK